MDYEWDENKRTINLTLHGVDFRDIENFDWATCFTVPDERFSENRYLSLGLMGQRLYAVAYAVRGNTIRIISLRKANKREGKRYENFTSRR